MATGARVDPFLDSHFVLEIDGIHQGGFTEVSGLSYTTNAVEYQEGGFDTVHKIPARTTYTNITLKWGLTASTELHDWYRDVARGIISRRNGSVILHDVAGHEVARWNFYDAWPTKIVEANLVGSGNGINIATVELACEKIERH